MDPKDKSNLDEILNAMAALAEGQKGIESRLAEEDAAKAAKAAEAKHKELAKSAAKQLVDELAGKLEASQEDFSKFVSANKDVLAQLSTEVREAAEARTESEKSFSEMETRISDLTQAVRSGANKFVSGTLSEKSDFSAEDVKNANDLVLLSWCKSAVTGRELGIFDTDYGKSFKEKAVNDSSSIQVSSENYETIFSTNLQKDIEERLVVKPFFQELPMTSKLLTVPLNPAYTYATWVDSAAYGTDASTGDEISVALTETTFRTFKLAAKAFITDETEEDVILSLVPILMDHLAEAHAKSIEKALLFGTGAANHQPTGLSTHATTLGTVNTITDAKFTGADVLLMRKSLGNYGMKLGSLKLIIGQEAYWDLLDDDAFKDASAMGDGMSQLRTGVVGKIHGLEVVISDEIPEIAAASTGDVAFLVYTPNYRVPRQRAYITQTDYDVESQKRIVVNTQRLGFQPMFATSKTVASTNLTKS